MNCLARTVLHCTWLAAVTVAGPAVAAVAPHPSAVPQAGATARRPATDFSRPSPAMRQLLGWIHLEDDNHGAPFAIIDKPRAHVYVFDGEGRLQGHAPVLLGLAKGDETAPGVGDKPLSQVKTSERTTPAGRFVTEHGQNMRGEHVIWIDYDAAVSMHPVLTTNPKEHRLQRLATPGVADNRISYGCVNVPTQFFANVVLKTLSTEHPIVYVLPDRQPLDKAFAGLASGLGGTPVHQAAAGPLQHSR